MKLPPLPEEFINRQDPQKLIIYWETHVEELRFIKEFVMERLLQDLEYLSIVWDRNIQPDYDNGWTRIWIVTYILQDYKDLILNNRQLPKENINIKELLEYLERNHSNRDICLTEVSLRKLISRTYEQLRKFYLEKGFLLQGEC